ncbi:MAG: hypothetical protein HQK81_14885 [Desulfovibrionaceae bacterium]|nr:hypothetical protein [Desulfovibrionaceae bacterium]
MNDELCDFVLGDEVDPDDLDLMDTPAPGSAEEDHAREVFRFLILPVDGPSQ